ncbi:MAG: outer membrane beta-barrel protein [Prolixibacteraceae bacterium]|nr:outer membrane beta-barrel protein [Prolixibacteraceae bacterium]
MLTFYINVSAQICFYRGYIITNTNDTINGFISDNGELGNSSVCKFKENLKSKAIRYQPGEIKSYRFSEGKYYKSHEISVSDKKETVFVEVLLEDKVSLYSYWKKFEYTYFLVKENGDEVMLKEEMATLLNKNNQRYYSFVIASYKDSLDAAFAECSGIEPEIENLDYTAHDLMNITKEYINCTHNSDNPKGYEKDLTRSKLSFGLFTGAQISKINFLDSDIQSEYILSVPYGIFLNVPVSLLNERISFQFELYANRLDYNNAFFNLPPIYKDITIGSNQVSLPMMIKYSFLGKKFSPSIGIGKEFTFMFNTLAKTTPVGYDFENQMSQIEFEYRQRGFYVHHYQKEGWFVDLGLDYKISRKLSVFSNLRLMSGLNLIIEEKSYNNHLFDVAEKMNNLDNPHNNIYRTYSGVILFGIKF